MIEVEHSTRLAAPLERVWEYVWDIPNWAPFVVGYQRLRLVDDRTSVWTLRGDIGILAREVDIKVEITEWQAAQVVRFALTGVTERLEGSGEVRMEEWRPDPCSDVGGEPRKRRRLGVVAFIRALRGRALRALLRAVGGSSFRAPVSPRVPAAAAEMSTPATPPGADSPDRAAGTRLSFRLALTPVGPMAPMVELLMNPLLMPAAEELVTRIRDVLEKDGDKQNSHPPVSDVSGSPLIADPAGGPSRNRELPGNAT